MAETKALPAIVRMRAERILKKAAKAAYRVDVSDANLLKVVLLDDKVTYVNLKENREVKSTELKVIVVDDNQETAVTETPAKDKMISRKKAAGDTSSSNKRKKGDTTRKTSTKKAK